MQTLLDLVSTMLDHIDEVKKTTSFTSESVDTIRKDAKLLAASFEGKDK